MKLSFQFFLTVVLLVIFNPAIAFNNKLEAFLVDVNNDSYLDIYFKEKDEIILIHGDVIIPIVLPRQIQPFALIQDSSNNSFYLDSSNLNGIGLDESSTKLDIVNIDINMDGNADFIVRGVGNHIVGQADQIIYASSIEPDVAESVKPISQDMKQFFIETYAWLFNRDYFEDAAYERGDYTVYLGQTVEQFWKLDFLFQYDYEYSPGNPYIFYIQDAYNPDITPYGCDENPDGCRFEEDYYATGDGVWLVETVATERLIEFDYSSFNPQSRQFAQTIEPYLGSGLIEPGSQIDGQIKNGLSYIIGSDFDPDVGEDSTDPSRDNYRNIMRFMHDMYKYIHFPDFEIYSGGSIADLSEEGSITLDNLDETGQFFWIGLGGYLDTLSFTTKDFVDAFRTYHQALRDLLEEDEPLQALKRNAFEYAVYYEETIKLAIENGEITEGQIDLYLFQVEEGYRAAGVLPSNNFEGVLQVIDAVTFFTAFNYKIPNAHNIHTARVLGESGEAAVRLARDIGLKRRIRVNGRNRIPDGINDELRTVSEVKNVKKQGWTAQLKDYAAWARDEGYTFTLYVRENTEITQPLLDAIDAGEVILEKII